jgi:hypothetical protein
MLVMLLAECFLLTSRQTKDGGVKYSMRVQQGGTAYPHICS